MVDTPGTRFADVAEFLREAAFCLGLPRKGERHLDRVWLVDGNHDYRRGGTFGRVNPQGIELGGYLTRHRYWTDPELKLLVVGFNSSAAGALARGAITPGELHELNEMVRREANQIRLRVALVHHHLLTLPAEPIDPRSWTQRWKARIFDESTKLLENAGLVARHLLDAHYDLVLHGHEHKRFAAPLSRLDTEINRPMAIIGGTSADRGFALIRLKATGEVTLQSFDYSENSYRPAIAKMLWSGEDWRRLEWQHTSRENGWYEHYAIAKALDFSGDVAQRAEVSGIHGPFNDSIVAIPVSIKSSQLGTAVMDRFFDKQTTTYLQNLPSASERPVYNFNLSQPARYDTPHPGYRLKCRILNTFATSRLEAAAHNLTTAEEFTEIRTNYPTRRVTLQFQFPSGRVPEGISVQTSEANNVDFGESKRAENRLVFDREFGLAILDLEWVLPRYRYELHWALPEAEHAPPEERDMAERQTRRLLSLRPGQNSPLEPCLYELRERICREQLQQPQFDDINLSLLVFDPSCRSMLVVASTYGEGSQYHDVRLPWGKGVAGEVMRRRRPKFVDNQDRRTAGIYHTVSEASPERYVFCAPLPIPWDSRLRGRADLHPSLVPAVLSLASVENPAMMRLENSALAEQIANTLVQALVDALFKLDKNAREAAQSASQRTVDVG